MKTPRWLVLLLAGAAVLAAAAAALAAGARVPSHYKTSLDTRQEAPRPEGTSIRAGGSFSADLNANVLTWNLSFKHLTGAATQAHIHVGARGKPGAVLIPLCAPCKSPVKGVTKLTAAQVAALGDKKIYVNVHTAKNPAGEVRGQLR